jgi:hypothetical protein
MDGSEPSEVAGVEVSVGEQAVAAPRQKGYYVRHRHRAQRLEYQEGMITQGCQRYGHALGRPQHWTTSKPAASQAYLGAFAWMLEMQFNDYTTLRNRLSQVGLRFPGKPRQARGAIAEMASRGLLSYDGGEVERITEWIISEAATEDRWCELGRPFYNIWPVAVSLSQEVKLSLPFSSIKNPFDSLLLRFARGREPCGVATAMLHWRSGTKQTILVRGYEAEGEQISFGVECEPEACVEEWLLSLR